MVYQFELSFLEETADAVRILILARVVFFWSSGGPQSTDRKINVRGSQMALDHYISRVHLKQFTHKPNTGQLHAIRKSDLKQFPPLPADVCRVPDGSTNEYLTENRAVEGFLKGIEPAYEPCLTRLLDGEFDWQCREVFAGFLAYIQIYSPAAIRMFDPMIRKVLERTRNLLEESGELAPIDLPEVPSWHGKSLSQLVDEGEVVEKIDLKMPQAMATTQLLKIQKTLASCDITVMKAGSRNYFLTSDFPSVILFHLKNKFAQRFIPISPKVGLWFHTETSSEERTDLQHRVVEIGTRRVQNINDEIIKSAENLVFATHKFPWLASRVKRFRRFRSESVTDTFGSYILSQQRVVEASEA